MLFKVYNFCVRPVHMPSKKHGIDDDDYMGAYKTPFKYKNGMKETIKNDSRDFGKRLDFVIESEEVDFE